LPWIHEEKCFTEEHIRKRAAENGFSDPLHVEYFLWDCEIAAQLQTESDDFVLKGGAAVQLHLPIEKQRGSIDVDIACSATKEAVDKAILNIHKRIPAIEFVPYTPKNPKVTLNLLAYDVKTPAFICYRRNQQHYIKVDFLMEDLDLPSEVVKNVRTFATDVRRIRCYSAPSLIGDKLLALAKNTLGVQDIDNFPKHLYDVSQLSEDPLSKTQLMEAIGAINKLVPLEARYRKIKVTPEAALSDIIGTLDEYSTLDLIGEAEAKNSIRDFQSCYVRESQRKPWFGWCIRACRVRFLSKIILAVVSKQITPDEGSNEYKTALEIGQKLQKLHGVKIADLNKKVTKVASTPRNIERAIINKSPERVFWHVVERKNLTAIRDLIGTETKPT